MAAPKALQARDRAAVGLGHHAELAGLRGVQPEDLVDEDADDRREQARVVRDTSPELKRQAQDPLPHRHLGEDASHDVLGAVLHSASATGRTKTAAFARKRNQDAGRTRLASGPQETSTKQAAIEKSREGVEDERGRGGAIVTVVGLAQRIEVVAHDAMQRRLLRPSPIIAEGGGVNIVPSGGDHGRGRCAPRAARAD